VIIGDFNIAEIAVFESETDTVLFVDPDAVLPIPVSFEQLQLVSRRHSEIIQRIRIINQHQFHQCLVLNGMVNHPRKFLTVYFLCLFITECSDHKLNIPEMRVYVKQVYLAFVLLGLYEPVETSNLFCFISSEMQSVSDIFIENPYAAATARPLC
jgi:hypothetical protein